MNHEAVYRTAPATPGLLNTGGAGQGRLENFQTEADFFLPMASLRVSKVTLK